MENRRVRKRAPRPWGVHVVFASRHDNKCTPPSNRRELQDLIPSFFMRFRRVEGGTPKASAASPLPAINPLVISATSEICSRSASASVHALPASECALELRASPQVRRSRLSQYGGSLWNQHCTFQRLLEPAWTFLGTGRKGDSLFSE